MSEINKDYKDYIREYESIINKKYADWTNSDFMDYADYVVEAKISEDNYIETFGDITVNMPLDKFIAICEHYGFKMVYQKEFTFTPMFSKNSKTAEEYIFVCENKGLILHAKSNDISDPTKKLESLTLFGEYEKNGIYETFFLEHPTDGLIRNLMFKEGLGKFVTQWTLPHYISLINDEEEYEISQKFDGDPVKEHHRYFYFDTVETGKITLDKIKSISELSNIVNDETLKELSENCRKH